MVSHFQEPVSRLRQQVMSLFTVSNEQMGDERLIGLVWPGPRGCVAQPREGSKVSVGRSRVTG